MRQALLRVLVTLSAVAALTAAGSSAAPPASAADTLAVGQGLTAGQSLTSRSGSYALVVQGDGNVVTYAPGLRALWSSHTSGNPGAQLVFQGDGNLVVYAASGRALWNSGTWGNPGARLILQDDGNLVIYRSNNTPAWNTGPDPAPPKLTAPAPTAPTGDTMTVGQQLAGGQSMRSADARYSLVMQTDGNLVSYAPGLRVLWNSRTAGNSGARLVLQGDGNLVIYSTTGRALWNTGTQGSAGARLAVQNDGNVVLYRPDNTPAWNTGPDRSALPLPVDTGNSTQLITVVASSASATGAQLTAWEKRNGTWVNVFGPVSARVGSSGIGQAGETSTKTPAGTFTLTESFGRLADPGTALPYRVIDGNDWWVSDVNSPLYNRYARCAPGTCSFNEAAGENLYAQGSVYDHAVVIDYNRGGTPGAGSAFFLHVANANATAGCVAIGKDYLATLMLWLQPAATPLISIGVG